MAFDGITTKIVIHELNTAILGSRVEKIYVPNRNEIWFSLHTADRKSIKLLISIDANNCRLHLSNEVRNNPEKAPQFCMVLRKYLTGAKLLSITQVGLDRIIQFTFETLNDFGDIVQKDLIVELMGKYSNVILLDDMKILDSIRHVDLTMSSVREVLPGKKYCYPSSMGKYSLEEMNDTEFCQIVKQKVDASEHDTIYLVNVLTSLLTGFSKSFIESVCEFLHMKEELKKDEITTSLLETIFHELNFVLREIGHQHVSFTLKEGQKDYSINIPLLHEATNANTQNNSVSAFLDHFYAEKENVSLVKTAKLNIKREVNASLNKLRKKLIAVNQTLEDEPKLELYKQYGELISANIYKMQMGMEKLVTENYYQNNQLVEIPLQVNLTPSRNAQSYFKKYNKLKGSITHAKEYQKSYEEEINYLSSVLFELEDSSSLFEIDEIHEELVGAGYLKKQNKKGKKKDEPSTPLEFEFNGIKILVGRNNIQNDRLTLKIARKNYTWLHTKKIHGSHVIIESETVDDATLYYAASLAKAYSEAKNSSKVEVDYTLVKYVHKESGAKPGMVVYTDYQTIIVE